MNREETIPALTALHIDHPLHLDGKLDDPLWRSAKPVELGFEFDPGENIAAPQTTLAYALYTRETLYFGFMCRDTQPQEIRANLSDRDKIFQDDYVLVSLDTYGDYQRAYQLAVNPFGIQGDRLATLNGEDKDYDLIWQSAAVQNDSGWTAELAIPFKSLRFPNQDEQSWRIHLMRNLPRSSRIQLSWMPIDRNNPSQFTQSGRLLGLQGIRASGSLEILPYALGQQTGALADAASPGNGLVYNKMKGRIGGGIQYAPGPNFSLDAVINPDFSQIETDADQISVNTTFALDYPEKRPFFLTGQDLLQTPMYYSRSINNPAGAGRIIGKSGALSYLLLAAMDRNTTFIIPGEEESDTVPSDVQSVASIGRLRYDMGDESYVGGMLLARNLNGGHNYVAGVDWNRRFWNNWYFSGEGFVSHTQELDDLRLLNSGRPLGRDGRTAALDGESYYGNGIHLVLNRDTRSYDLGVVYNDFSPTYQTYNGMFPNTDYRQIYTDQIYTFYPKDSFIDRWELEVASNLQFNHANQRKEFYIMPGIEFRMKGQTQFEFAFMPVSEELFHEVKFNKLHRAYWIFSTAPSSLFSLDLEAQLGKFIYRTETPVLGQGARFDAALGIKPTSKWNLTFNYAHAELHDENTDANFYKGYLLRTVISYQFNSTAHIRLIGQYNSFADSYSIYPLFSYKMNALTTFYAGVTNDWSDFGEPWGRHSTARQYFAKLQYLIR